MKPKPDFVCIGYSKTGTTWLAAVLDGHPDIFIHLAKEVNYNWGAVTSKRWYSPFLKNPIGRSLVNYRIHWKKRVFTKWKTILLTQSSTRRKKAFWKASTYFSPVQTPLWYTLQFSQHKLSGDLTPHYITSYSDREIKLLLNHNPAVKIMCRLRNPIDQAWFRAKMLGPRKHTPSFETIFTASLRQALRFPEHLDRWQKYVPKDQFHLSFYEDFRADNQAHLEEILAFLEVPIPRSRLFNRGLDNKVNKGSSDSQFNLTLRKKAARETLPLLEDFQKILPEHIYQSWTKRTEKLATELL